MYTVELLAFSLKNTLHTFPTLLNTHLTFSWLYHILANN